MVNWIIDQTIDLQQGYRQPHIVPDALMADTNILAHKWRIQVMDGGMYADLTGATVTGYFLRNDNVTVQVAGSVNGSVASVVLSQQCYAVPGQLVGSIRLVKGGVSITLATAVFHIQTLTSGDVVNPGVTYASFEIDASPAGVYANLAALQAAAPDPGKIYLTQDDGKWNYHNGTAWTTGGLYQAVNLSTNQVKAANIDKTAAVKFLLQETTTKRITPSNIPDNTTVAPSAYFLRDYLPAIITAGERYHFVLKTNLLDGSLSNSFRINARAADNSIISTAHSQYLGDGVFAILDYIPPSAAKYQLVVHNTTTSDIVVNHALIAEGGYPAIRNEDTQLLTTLLMNATTRRVIGNNVEYYNGSSWASTRKTTDESFILPNGHIIIYNFNITDGLIPGKYTFAFHTDVTDANKSTMFRISKRVNDYPAETIPTQYIGEGIFAALDYEITAENDVYRVAAWNDSGATITVHRILVGIDGFPVASSEHNNNLYPLYPVWGHEYLYSWYNKIRTNAALKMVWAGDSTTYGGGLDSDYLRHTLGKKIMTLGGYPAASVTSINAGHGMQHTGNWLGGNLYEDMQQNPDLYIIAYGINDGSNNHFPDLTWQQRVDRFEENMREGLLRIRYTMYNKSPDDMAIILCTPVSTNGSGQQSPQRWGDRIRPVIQRLCRDYKCAFVDVLARQYDHAFSNAWSTNGDYVHPKETANADYMSMFADLLFPLLLHK